MRAGAAPSLYHPGAQLKDAMASCERRFLAGALAHHGGNVTATAKALGVARRTMQEKMARHGLR